MSEQVRIGQLARAVGLHENTIRRLADAWSFEIIDDGCGVYSKIMKEFKLENRFKSVAELSKGKQTTALKAHSGEGIFFTSKTVDVFELSSDGIHR